MDGRGRMDTAQAAEELRQAFLTDEERWPQLKHLLVWSPFSLVRQPAREPQEVCWGSVSPAGRHLYEMHWFRFAGSERDANEARARLETLARRALDWLTAVPDDVRPQHPHSGVPHNYSEAYLDWVDLLYLLGQDNRIHGLGAQTSWGVEESGMERKAPTLAGWELLDFRTTPPTRQPRLREQAVVWTPSSTAGRNLYWTPRAWLQENVWYASAAAVGYLAEKARPSVPSAPAKAQKTRLRRRRRRTTGRELTAKQVEALTALAACEGNFAKAGRYLGLNPKSVRERVEAAYKKQGISLPEMLKQMRAKPATQQLPHDKGGQVHVAEEDDHRRGYRGDR